MSSPWSARRAPSTRRAAPASTRAAGPPLRWTALLPAAAVATAAALVAAGIASAPPVVFEAVQRRYFSQQRPWLSSAHLRASHLDIAALEHAQRLVFCSSGDEDRIYTGDMALDGSAEAHACIAIEGRHVVAIGSPRSVQADGCKKQQHNSSQTVDGRSGHRQCSFHQLAPGHSILPGLHDAHGHVLDLGWARSAVDLVGATSTQDVITRIEKYIRERPELLADETQWVQGLGWDQTKWDPPVFPTADDLSRSSPLLAHRRIVLRRVDVHALWLSRAALDDLAKAGVVPPDGTDIEGGLVVRDEQGNPRGCFIDRAMDLAYKVIPPWTDKDRKRYLDTAARELLSLGITSVGDAAVDLDSLRYYVSREEDGEGLPLRIYAMLACPPDEPRCSDLARTQGFPRIAAPLSRERLTVRTVKLFADGALGSWGSAMWEPYSDRADDGWRGLLLMAAEEVRPLIEYWVDAGWNVATHCIGDRAQTIVLDAYEHVLRRTDAPPDARFRIEHAQLLRPSDIPRFGSLGVIASMQPTHCTSDMGYVETRIGYNRAAGGAYPWQALLRANASLALGSDFPVEDPNVMHGIYSAVTRRDEHGDSPHGPQGWFPSQRLSRAQALHGFTAAPAHAQFEEKHGGTLHPGKRADFVLASADVARQHGQGGVSDHELRQVSVVATFIDGRVAWHRPR